jgi:hypothetical protein
VSGPHPDELVGYFAVQVVPVQTYRVVLVEPSVRSHKEPLPVGAVPHVDVGAPAPTPMETPLTLVLTPYGPTAPTKFPGLSVVSGVTVKAPIQKARVCPTGVVATMARFEVPEVAGTKTNEHAATQFDGFQTPIIWVASVGFHGSPPIPLYLVGDGPPLR